MKDDIPETVKVAAIGAGGAFTSLTLSDVATITSIAVGLATLVYIITKTVLLIKRRGNGETS